MIGFYDYTVVVTYISLVSSILGMFCAIDGKLTLAVSCLAFSGLCDMFDGKIARTKKNRTDDEIMPLLFVASVFFPGFRYFVGLLHAAMLIVGFLFIFNFRFRKPTNQELVVLVAVVAVAVLFILFYKEGWWAHYHTIRKLKGAAA